jgi:hypothetical protein
MNTERFLLSPSLSLPEVTPGAITQILAKLSEHLSTSGFNWLLDAGNQSISVCVQVQAANPSAGSAVLESTIELLVSDDGSRLVLSPRIMVRASRVVNGVRFRDRDLGKWVQQFASDIQRKLAGKSA